MLEHHARDAATLGEGIWTLHGQRKKRPVVERAGNFSMPNSLQGGTSHSSGTRIEYNPPVDDEPALARTMAASVQQRSAFGEWAGPKVRRIGSGFGYEGEHPALTGTRCASVHRCSLHANTQVPAHRRDQWERLLLRACHLCACAIPCVIPPPSMLQPIFSEAFPRPHP
jgi:hypothetical protein